MTAPPIQFTTTEDGAAIAFWESGEGIPLVHMPSLPWSHLELEWGIAAIRRWYESLARTRRVVRYDGRGFGLSQREVDDISLEGELRDLEAVIDRLGVESVDIYAGLHSGPPAVAYAGRNPERVRHLILFSSYADGAAFGDAPLTKTTRPIALQDWSFYTEAVARLLLGWTEPEAASRFAELVRECTTPEIGYRALMSTTEYDVTGVLGEVRAPTLVVARRELNLASQLAHPRALAAGIPDAQFVVIDGNSAAPYLGDVDELVELVDSFLSGRERRPATTDAGGLRTILFTDLEGSTELTDRLGDEEARSLVRDHEAAVRRELDRHGGREIKTMGDGFMASFASAVSALECAAAIQRDAADGPVRVRIGLSAGEPIAEEDDLYGTAVIAASRISAQGAGGEVLVADVVRQLVAGKEFQFTDLGDTELRGLSEPVRISRLEWR